MKKTSLILILFLVFGYSYGQTTLAAGDIVITGFNSDDRDQFTFVLLRDVTNTTTIKFTDNGWLASGSFRGNEGVIEWTATSDLPCGTEILVTDDSPFSVTSGSITDSGLFALAVGGDQILAYQGVETSPTFINAINFDSAGWSEASNSNTSAIPDGLTVRVNALNLGEIDNADYNCATTIGQSAILASVSNRANWNLSNNRIPILSSCTYTCGPCTNGKSTWDGTAWNNGIPNLTTQAILNGNYDTDTNGNFSACSLAVNTGFNLNVANNTFVEIENDVIVNGNVTVENTGSFVQNDNGGTFILNGTSSVTKQTPPKADWFYYTYWSSPVNNETIGNAFPDAPADRRFWFNAANFVDTNNDDVDDNGNDWQRANAADVMIPGVGYTATEARFHLPGATGTATFQGPYNTGDIPVTISLNAANTGVNWNFIGNPYPSALDFDAFHSANSSIVEGAAYFWSQASPPSELNPGNSAINFNLNDYVVYTVGAGAGTTPGVTGFVGSCQGFFIPAISAGTATFTNAMRIADGTSNSQFFKNDKTKKSNTTENKLWLNLTSGNGVSNQILIAYVDGATDDYDGMYYDAPKLLTQDFAAALYSLSESDQIKYAIQCKDEKSINETEIIKFGLSTNIEVATIYSLSLEHIEGDFLSNNTVYLKDNISNTVHNLSDSDYSFTSEVGEFNDRFELTFSNALLSNTDFEVRANTIKIVQLRDATIKFTTEASTFKTIKVYDLLGRSLYTLNAQNTEETFNLTSLKRSVYIANIELANGQTISKKFIIK